MISLEDQLLKAEIFVIIGRAVKRVRMRRIAISATDVPNATRTATEPGTAQTPRE